LRTHLLALLLKGGGGRLDLVVHVYGTYPSGVGALRGQKQGGRVRATTQCHRDFTG